MITLVIRSARYALIPALLCFASCVTSPKAAPLDPGDSAINAVAEQLVTMAELRIDLSAIRVHVRPIEVGGESLAGSTAPTSDLGREIQKELTLALTTQMNVIDLSALGDSKTPAADAPGTTHIVVGDYVQRDGETIVSVRMVELGSHLIVATARGFVDPTELLAHADAQIVAEAQVAPPEKEIPVTRVPVPNRANPQTSRSLRKPIPTNDHLSPARSTAQAKAPAPKLNAPATKTTQELTPVSKTTVRPQVAQESKKPVADLEQNYNGPALQRYKAISRGRNQELPEASEN